jgi:anthraniloyl-CoA monooxygenase
LDKLAARDARFVADVSAWWAARHNAPPLATPLSVGGRTLDHRIVRWGVDDPVPFRAPGDGQGTGDWGLVLTAPDSEADLPAAIAELEAGVAAGACIVAVAGGSPVTRVLLCEEARLVRGVPALLIDDTLRAAQAATLLLAGRADLVGATEPVAESWAAEAATAGTSA